MKERAPHTDRVTQCADGKYRWTYELSLYKDPTVFLLVWRILIIISLVVCAVVIVSDAANWGMAKAVEDLPFLAYFLIGATALTALGYLLYAGIMGGKYIVEFEMDESGVMHTQTASQAKKAKTLGVVTMLAGAISGRPTTAAVGMNARRTQMYTDFASVRSVKAYARRGLIKVGGRLSHNQIYAPKEDFDFVKTYVTSHCQNVKQ